jgi:hypothetical protein
MIWYPRRKLDGHHHALTRNHPNRHDLEIDTIGGLRRIYRSGQDWPAEHPPSAPPRKCQHLPGIAQEDVRAGV